jgi:hypothetical protein
MPVVGAFHSIRSGHRLQTQGVSPVWHDGTVMTSFCFGLLSFRWRWLAKNALFMIELGGKMLDNQPKSGATEAPPNGR